MYNVDQFYAALVYVWTELQSKYPIMGFLIAMTISLLATWKRKRTVEIAEALLCGIFAAIGVASSKFIGIVIGWEIPIEAYAIMSGAIGWFGTDSTVNYLKGKFGAKDNDSNNSEFQRPTE